MSMIQLFLQSYMEQVRESFWMIMLTFVLIWGMTLVLIKIEVLQTKMKTVSGMAFMGIFAFAVSSVLVMTLFGREPRFSGQHFEFELFGHTKHF